MAEMLWITMLLIVVTIGGILAFLYYVRITQTVDNEKKIKLQGVVKHDWLPTGRIDFTTRFEDVGDQSKDKPGEFKLLVEERRIVESIAGNENLEIQWRLATLSEAKTVISQYHKYLTEDALIKSILEFFASLPAPHSVSSPLTNGKEPSCFVVRDHNGQALAYVCFEDEPGRRSAAKLLTKDEARRIAVTSFCGKPKRKDM